MGESNFGAWGFPNPYLPFATLADPYENPPTREAYHVFTNRDEIAFIDLIMGMFEDSILVVGNVRHNVREVYYRSSEEFKTDEDYKGTMHLCTIDDFDERAGAYWPAIFYHRRLLVKSRPGVLPDRFTAHSGGASLYVAWWRSVPHRKEIVLGVMKAFKRFAPDTAVVINLETGQPEEQQWSWAKTVHFGPDAARQFREHPDWVLNHSYGPRDIWLRPAEPGRRRS